MPDTSSPHEIVRPRARENVWAKWLVSAPPLVYLLFFFAMPTLIMVLASFRTPGEFGGLSPLVEDGKLDLNLDSYVRFFTESIYAQIFVKSVWYALLTTLFCLAARVPAGDADRAKPEEVSRSSPAAGDPSFLEQLPDPRLCVDDHPRPERGDGARPERRAGLVRTRAGAVALQFLRGADLPGVRASAVHGLAAVRQPGKARSGAARRGAGSGSERMAAVLAHYLSAVAAGRLCRRGAGIHPGARDLRHSRHPGRAGGQPDRQRHQATVPRDARLAVRQRALDRADRRGTAARAAWRRGSAAPSSAHPRAELQPVRKRPRRSVARRRRGLRLPVRAAHHRHRLFCSTIRASTPNGSGSRSTGTTSFSTTRKCWPPPAIRSSSRW